MANIPTEADDGGRAERAALLTGLLRELVELVQRAGRPTWTQLERTVAGRRAVMRLDDVVLKLSAREAPLRVDIEVAAATARPHLASRACVLRALIAGRTVLDAALARGDIEVRGERRELLAMYRLVLALLADGALDPELRALWARFDAEWPADPPVPAAADERKHNPCPRFALQPQPQHARWVRAISPRVLLVRPVLDASSGVRS